MQPLQHPIYKGMGGKQGAMQFNLQHPHFYPVDRNDKRRDFTGEEALLHINGRATRKILEDENGNALWKQREGAVFLEASSATGKNKYDWTNSIKFALSVTDLGKILSGWRTGTETELLHDPGAGGPNKGQVMKKVTVTAPGDRGVMFFIKMRKDGKDTQHQIGISPDELRVLDILFTKAVSSAYAW